MLRSFHLLLLLSLILGPTLHCHADLFDLNADWSDLSNPNGVWSYRSGTELLPSGTIAGDFTSQPGWTGANGFTLPLMLKTQSNPSGFDIVVGDIVTHTTDAANGGTNSLSLIRWTSPADGTIDISGGVWMIRDIGRGNDWFIRLNGTLLSTGNISSGDAFDRANPYDLNSGSGGPLSGISVSSGDILWLSLQKTGTFGDYVGINFSVNLTAIPEPASCLIMAPLAAIVTCRRRKRLA